MYVGMYVRFARKKYFKAGAYLGIIYYLEEH